MNLHAIPHPKASIAILGAGLALGLALRFLELIRPVGAVLGH
jgi:hypothetical protein